MSTRRFCERDDSSVPEARGYAIVLSAAFASNIAALFSLSRKQEKDSLLTTNVCVISDELNHRSIIDGVRIANLPKEDKRIFKHRDVDSLEAEIRSCVGKYDRLMIVTDGVFSMLGAYQDLNAVRKLIDRYIEDRKSVV